MGGPLLHTDIVLPYLIASADDEQKERWLPGVASGEQILAIAMTEPGTGSDLAGIKARAKRDGDDYVLNGAKTFITNGINADLVVVAARTSDDTHGGLSLFVVERGMPGFERGKQIEKIGQHASDTAELFFEDVRVPQENLLGAEGSGLPAARVAARARATDARRHLDGRRRGRVPDDARLREGAQGVRQADRLLPEHALHDGRAADRDRDRPRFVDRCIQRYVDGTCTIEEAAMAKYWTTDLLCKVADHGVQFHGGYGYTTEYPISKAWVDSRITRIYAGTNEIMKELIGKTMGL